MRPTYQKQEDAINQTQVIVEVCDNWVCDVFPFSDYSLADFLLVTKESKIMLAEVKCRKNSKSKYPTLILSTHKVDKIIEVAEHLKIKAFLFVRWEEGIFWIELKTDNNFVFSIGGRSDRGDSRDREFVYEIPVQDFRALKPLNRA